MQEPEYHFDAFISYSHAADQHLAPALQQSLERIARPWYRLRALRVFRDRTNLSVNPQLWGSIVKHLSMSRWFLLLASPESANSKWVRKEVKWWLANRSADQLLIVLTDGKIVWDDASGDFDWTTTTALPRSLSGRYGEMPHFGDFTGIRSAQTSTFDSAMFREAALTVAAALHGLSKDDMDGQAVRTLRRNRLWAAAAASAVLAFFALALVNLARSREEQWNTGQALRQSEEAFANSMAGTAARLREGGDELAAVRVLAEASSTAFTPVVQANLLVTEKMQARLERILPQSLASRAIAFAPKAPIIALGLFTGEVVIFDFLTGTEVARANAGSDPVVGLAFSAAGDRIYSVLRSPADAIWNPSAHDEQRSAVVEMRVTPNGAIETLRRAVRSGAGDHFDCIDVDPTTGNLVVGTQQGVVRAKDLGQLNSTKEQPWGALHPAAATVTVSLGGEHVGSSDTKGNLRVFSAGKEYGFKVEQPGSIHPYSEYRLSFMRDGAHAVFGAHDGRTYIWDFLSDEEPWPLSITHEGGVATAIVSRDGYWLATGGWDGVGRITQVRTHLGRDVALDHALDRSKGSGNYRFLSARLPALRGDFRPNVRLAGGLSALAFSPDSKFLGAVSVVPVGHAKSPGRWLFGRVHIWSLDRPRDDRSIGGVSRSSSIAFDGRGRLLTVVGDATTTRLEVDGVGMGNPVQAGLHTPTFLSQLENRFVSRVQYGASEGSQGAAFYRRSSPSGSLLLSCQFSPNGSLLAFIDAHREADRGALVNGSISILSLDSDDVKKDPLPVEKIAGVTAFAWTADLTRVALALAMPLNTVGMGLDDAPTRVFVFDVASREFAEIEGALTNSARALAWRPGAEELAIAGGDGAVAILDTSGRQIWRAAEGLFADHTLLAFSNDGRRLFAGTMASLRSWTRSNANWTANVTPVGVDFRPTAIVSTPDSRLIVVGEESGRISVRSARTLETIASVVIDASPVLELAMRPDGLNLAIVTKRGRFITGNLPPDTAAAARLTNWAVVEGQPVLPSGLTDRELPRPAEIVPFDSAAAQLWRIMSANDAVVRERVSLIGWVMGKQPLRPSPELEEWMRTYPMHPFTPRVVTLAAPD